VQKLQWNCGEPIQGVQGSHQPQKQYILQKINDYEKGGQIDEVRLMMLVENKYKNLVFSGECKSPLEEQKEILAMKANAEGNEKGSNANKHEWNKKAPNDLKR